MEILNRSKYKREEVIIDCEKCKSKLEIDIGDLHDSGTYHYVFCKVCGCSNEITKKQLRVIYDRYCG